MELLEYCVCCIWNFYTTQNNQLYAFPRQDHLDSPGMHCIWCHCTEYTMESEEDPYYGITIVKRAITIQLINIKNQMIKVIEGRRWPGLFL